MIAIHKTPFKRNVKKVAETMFTYPLKYAINPLFQMTILHKFYSKYITI